MARMTGVDGSCGLPCGIRQGVKCDGEKGYHNIHLENRHSSLATNSSAGLDDDNDDERQSE